MEVRKKKPVLYDPFNPPGATRISVFTPTRPVSQPVTLPDAPGSPAARISAPMGGPPDKIELALHPPGSRAQNTFSMG